MSIALITGTSTGIGLETAVHFARNGYRVFAGARKPEQAEQLQKAIAEGLPIVPITLDVNRDDSVRDAVAKVLAEAGAIDVLVNNAGVGGAGAIELVPLEAVRAFFETNFYGAVRLMQAVLPGMRERRAGTIVNVGSMMGRLTLGCHGFYAASKFALAAVTETLAVEVKPFGVRVALIEPGVILTPIWGKGEALMPKGHPYGRAFKRTFGMFGAQMEGGTPADDVARAILQVVMEGAPRLHNPVGVDAEVMVAGRDRITSEEWVGMQTEPDEERFLAGAERIFGVDLYHPPSLHSRRKAQAGG